mgnify:CR=1 FL=1
MYSQDVVSRNWRLVLIATTICSACSSNILIGLCLQDIWNAPVDLFGWSEAHQDPREAVLGFQVLSLKYLGFRLSFFTAVACCINLLLRFKQRMSIPRSIIAKYSALVLTSMALLGICLGISTRIYWRERSLPQNQYNIQSIFFHDLFYSFWVSVFDSFIAVSLIMFWAMIIRLVETSDDNDKG